MVTEKHGEWWYGTKQGIGGLFPASHVRELETPTEEERFIEQLGKTLTSADAKLREEHHAAEALRRAMTTAFEVVERVFKRTLKKKLILDLPPQDAVSGHKQSLDDRLAGLLAKHLQDNAENGVVSWPQLKSGLATCLAEACDQRRKKSSLPAASPLGHRKPPQIRASLSSPVLLGESNLDDDDPASAERGTQTLSSVPNRVPSRSDVVETRTFQDDSLLSPLKKKRSIIFSSEAAPVIDSSEEDEDASFEEVLTKYDASLRALFREYATSSPGETTALVSPADFLRCCRTTKVSEALLARQEVTTIFRLAMGSNKKDPLKAKLAPIGLNETQFRRALGRCAAAAYSHMPAMSLAEKATALFEYMGLLRRTTKKQKESSPQQRRHTHHPGTSSPHSRPSLPGSRGASRGGSTHQSPSHHRSAAPSVSSPADASAYQHHHQWGPPAGLAQHNPPPQMPQMPYLHPMWSPTPPYPLFGQMMPWYQQPQQHMGGQPPLGGAPVGGVPSASSP